MLGPAAAFLHFSPSWSWLYPAMFVPAIISTLPPRNSGVPSWTWLARVRPFAQVSPACSWCRSPSTPAIWWCRQRQAGSRAARQGHQRVDNAGARCDRADHDGARCLSRWLSSGPVFIQVEKRTIFVDSERGTYVHYQCVQSRRRYCRRRSRNYALVHQCANRLSPRVHHRTRGGAPCAPGVSPVRTVAERDARGGAALVAGVSGRRLATLDGDDADGRDSTRRSSCR